ncbi:MAG: N-6 DNA methylase, partial [Chloroflexi bacterium]|nr:N-6 DNA methylase [Chloroflexota bacterium]
VRLVRGEAARKERGSFFTPREVARDVARRTLGVLAERARPAGAFLPSVLDPAMGTGMFLLEAARYLAPLVRGQGARGAIEREGAWRADLSGTTPVGYPVPGDSAGLEPDPLPRVPRRPPREDGAAAPTGPPRLHGARAASTPAEPDDGSALRFAAESCLHGLDSDPLAVELAICSIALETGARPALLRRHLRCADGLGEGSAAGAAFDAVLGNPPWGARYSTAEWERLARRFPRSTRGALDSFKLFLDLASSLSRGALGMIVPQAVLAQAAHADIREALLERLDPYCALDLGDGVFPGVAAPACALIFGPKPGPCEVLCVDRRRASRRGGPGRTNAEGVATPVSAGSWNASRGFPLRRPAVLDLLQRLQSRYGTIGQARHLYRVRDVGINYNRAAVARRIMYTGPAARDARDVPRYRGRSFARYTSIAPDGWVRHDAQQLLQAGETLSLGWSTYGLPEKVVLRQTADRIVATLDRTRMAMGRSVIAITSEADVSLRALLACLNSRLLTVLYRSLAGEEGRILPQVKVARIKALPLADVPSIPASGEPPGGTIDRGTLLADAERDPAMAWASLDHLSDALLQAEGRDQETDALVDDIVYRLYGLTPGEVELVERAGGDADGRL